ncbi:uncharacterized protein N0V89_003538 [Didymosphaeria variabile]|uniref:BTB domain-containing protein n=1 Tax=Didymosphaeria variabile TaxID=1932322 RepID=A0A9W8XQ61_9PLEO|nr:uncharacterized protein N0V89_003538 [Didymosphaeria variabile]KAJ4355521.1 hypothetical protein N0V89_003538 [Didymosphaeria variabile]
MPTARDFFYTQYFAKIPKPAASFADKTVIVTGGNRGLGKETVKHIVRLAANKVIIGCRNEPHGQVAKREIEAITKCKPDILEIWELDIESPQSIRSFVERANQLSRLDVLINNAGISAFNFKVVYDTERTLAVNNIGTFLLAFQLIPKLKETARRYQVTPVMTTVASALYDAAKYPENHGDDLFGWFKDQSHVNKFNQYNLSKLLQIYTIRKLATIVDPPTTTNAHPIVINAMDPMFCKSDLGSEVKGAIKVAGGVFRSLTARSTEEGSRLIVKAASAGRETHGLYMRTGAVQEYAAVAKDEKRATWITHILFEHIIKHDRLKLFESGAIADVTLRIAEKDEILAHRAILGPESEVLRELFSQKSHYDEHFFILLPPDTSMKALKALVRFCYCGDYPGTATLLATVKEKAELHFQVHALAKTYNIISLCRHVAVRIARDCKECHAHEVLDWVKHLLDHTEASIRKAGVEILDDYLKQDARSYTSSDDFVDINMGDPDLNKLLLSAIYSRAHDDGADI